VGDKIEADSPAILGRCLKALLPFLTLTPPQKHGGIEARKIGCRKSSKGINFQKGIETIKISAHHAA
jgi:hypothetical protein